MDGPARFIHKLSRAVAGRIQFCRNFQLQNFLGFLVSHPVSKNWQNFAEVLENFSDCQTLTQLNKVIENHIGRGRPVLTLRYRGIILRDDAKVSYLVMDLRNIGTPRFNYSVLHADLKTDLEGCYGVKPCEQRLISEGKQLEDGKTLQECNEVEHIILTQLRTSACPAIAAPSTGRFFDMENTGSLMKIRLTKKAPLWRAAVEGLNVEGTCSNGECDAFGQMVICSMGLTVFNVAEECQCPICHEIFTRITCAFWKCTWMSEGRTRAGNIDMMSPWFDAGTKYERTSVLHKRKSRANEAGCAVCFEELMSDDAGISMPNCEYIKCGINVVITLLGNENFGWCNTLCIAQWQPVVQL
ncbi:hypothetical protein CY35_13G112800 [Sphagnum magellanicum]|nr:hypothetical protein CY35_13G112800 [Sphagnum magellanicum]